MATTLFLSTRSARHEGKTCRTYSVQDIHGAQQFTATAFRVPGRITIYAAADPDRPVILARPRRSFPLTGRYDVFVGNGESLGVITRSGRFYDARGRKLGRLHDARTWKQHLGEGVLSAVVEGMIAGDTTASYGPGADAYLITIGDTRAGRMGRERMPFETSTAPPAPPGRVVRILRRVVPKRIRTRFERGARYAWKLDVADSGDVPDLLLLAAAILAVEMALW